MNEMRRAIFAVAVLVATSWAHAQPGSYYEDPGAYAEESGAYFNQLDAYGIWVDIPPYGVVWQPDPQMVGPDFYPYGTQGRWVHTQYGWTFDSNFPWGRITFHYGRWVWAD